ncbi:hypothetical protein IWX88_000378 [Frigoribacterium sp. CG_9.8]|nr:leucine zipper domain-containing protein [Frigoribacterium sp. CG_9.8]MBG6106760.1 hypothetical protein [Frigoribacterium sp. CG_9.8]
MANHITNLEIFVSAANNALTPRHCFRIAPSIVDEGWPVVLAAQQLNVVWPKAKRWVERHSAMGAATMADRCSRPDRSPNKTLQELVRKIAHLRWERRLGPITIGVRLGMRPSRSHTVLVRCRLNKLHHVDSRAGELVHRYKHEKPTHLILVDGKNSATSPTAADVVIWDALKGRRTEWRPQRPKPARAGTD